MPLPAIAITGGAGEGKSTVLSYLKDLGLRTYSADEAARVVYNEPYIQELVLSLSGSFGSTKRDAVRPIIGDAASRRELNRITHPLIWKLICDAVADAIEIPLLFEACLSQRFRRVWVVTSGAEEQRRRLTVRYGPSHAERLMAAQMAAPAKCVLGDVVIRTNADTRCVKASVAAALQGEKWISTSSG